MNPHPSESAIALIAEERALARVSKDGHTLRRHPEARALASLEGWAASTFVASILLCCALVFRAPRKIARFAILPARFRSDRTGRLRDRAGSTIAAYAAAAARW